MIKPQMLQDVANEVLQQISDIADATNTSETSLFKRERIGGIYLVAHPSAQDFADTFIPDRVSKWFKVLGDDLRIQVVTHDPDHTFEIDSNSLGQLTKLLLLIDQIEIESMTVNVSLEKHSLKASLAELLGYNVAAVFYYPYSFKTRLDLKGIITLFDEGVVSLSNHSVICIMSRSGLIQSPFISVVGLLKRREFAQSSLQSPTASKRRWDTARALRKTGSIWSAPLVDVSPDTFQVQEVEEGLNELQGNLLGLSDVLSLMQFCSSVTLGEKQLLATVGSVSDPGNIALEVSLDQYFASKPEKIGTSAFRLYQWAFRSAGYDKIDVVRDLLAKEGSNVVEDRIAHLIDISQQILDSARASYKILRRRAFEVYFRSRENALSKVGEFIEETRQNIDKLRSDLLTRLLQFFAAIIAFLFASVLKPGEGQILEIIGIVLGAFYILLVGGFQMYPAWLQYRKTHEEAIRSINSYKELTPSERERLIGQIPTGKSTEFETWFWVCAGTYLLGFLGLLIALCVLLA